MNDSKMTAMGHLWKCFPRLEPEEKAIDTLTSFVRDAEHELLSVVTALQAHVDLLYDEQARDHRDVDRFCVVNRTIARLITDTNTLVYISEQAKAPRSNQKQMLEGLMQEIVSDTRSAFSISQVLLSCDIAAGTILIGNAGPLKLMITGMLLTVLNKCHKLDIIRVVGATDNRRVSLSFDAGSQDGGGVFEPWRLGKLRLMPLNGEGIGLSAIDAMARLHHGQLTVRTLSDERHGYRLIFRI